MRNEEELTLAQLSVVLLSKDVEDLTDEVVTVADNVERNSANITIMFEDVAAVQEDVATVQGDIVIVAEDVVTVKDDVATVQDNIIAVGEDVASLTLSDQQQAAQIQSLGTRGTWCGYQDVWSPRYDTITYDSLTFSDSNMNTGTPLNINTGI